MGRIMRYLGLLMLLIVPPLGASVHKDRVEPLRSLTVGFGTGETATFAFSGKAIATVSLRVGEADHAVPKGECAKLRDVRFETVEFFWNGSFESAARADYFSLGFAMGTEDDRAFGELPRVRLKYRNGKFAGAVVTRKVAANSSQDSDL